MEARLTELEAKLGLKAGASLKTEDISSRLDAIQATVDKHTTAQFRSMWKESRGLLKDLDPGMGLTHQQQPLLYKRQEVLAAASSLQTDMGEMSKILHLLMTSQPQNAARAAGADPKASRNTASTLREDQVTQAPVLLLGTPSSDNKGTVNSMASPEDQRRLDALRLTVEDLNGRTQNLVARMDQVLECYYSVMSAASEKCILADEAILARESHQV